MIGDLEHATFSNIEHQSIDFAVHCIRPWLVRIEQAINRGLFTDQEKGRFYCQFNLDGLMRGSYIRPAYDTTEDEAYEIIRNGLREAIDHAK